MSSDNIISSSATSDTLIPILNDSISIENENVSINENENMEELNPEEKSKLIKNIVESQEGLKALIQRVESVKNDHDKIQSENQILQTYINNLRSSDVLSSVSNNKKDGKVNLTE